MLTATPHRTVAVAVVVVEILLADAVECAESWHERRDLKTAA